MEFEVFGTRGKSIGEWNVEWVKGRAGQHFSLGEGCEVAGTDLE